MELLTQSRKAAWRRCRRFHHLKYDLRVEPVRKAEEMTFGSLFHAGLEGYRLAEKHRLSVALEAARAHAEERDVNEHELARAQALLTGYDQRWSDDDDIVQILGVETEFDAPLVNPASGRASRTFRRGGKMDALAVVRSLSGDNTLVVEVKTSSEDISLGSTYWQRLRMNGQISDYIAGAKSLGHDVHGCLYDVAQRPGHRPGKATPQGDRKYTQKATRLGDGTVRPAGSLYAGQREDDETPGEFRERVLVDVLANLGDYFVRGEVVRTTSEELEHAWDAWHTAREIREAAQAGYWPRNPDACMQFGRPCEYLPACSGQADTNDQTLYQIRPRQHAELSAEFQARIAAEATGDEQAA